MADADKEMIAKAAKAYGFAGWQSKHGYWNLESPDAIQSTHCHNWSEYCPDTGEKLDPPTFADAIAELGWNPTYDDSEALRLAVALKLQIKPMSFGVLVEGTNVDGICIEEPFGSDLLAATRLAITRAAAKMGETMQ